MNYTTLLFKSAFVVGMAILIGGRPALAANSTWSSTATGNWADSPNWTSGVPGTTSGTTSTDIATFTTALTAQRAVTVDANRNIGGITFGNTSAFGNTLATGAMLLSNGGVIQSLPGTGDHFDTISSNLTIQGDGGTAVFTANASVGGMNFGGTVSGVSTVGNTTTLTLNGTNTSTSNSGHNRIIGVVSDGVNGGKLSIVKSGTGTWTLNGANTFSGGVSLNQGTLRYFSSNSVFGTGTLTIANGTTLSHANSNAITIANDVQVNGNFTFATGANATFSGAMNLGGGTRQITVSVDTTISGAISNGALTKAGGNVLTLGGANTYVGDTTVSAGTLLLADNAQLVFDIGADGVNNGILGSGTLTLNGDFSFDLSGAGTTVGDSWNIVNVGGLTETFNSTFSVVGFTRQGGGTGAGIWEGNANSVTYQFDTSLGILSVIPEPSTWVLIAGGLTVVSVLRRRRMKGN